MMKTRVVVAAVALLVLAGCANLDRQSSGKRELMIVGNDEKVSWDADGKGVNLPPGQSLRAQRLDETEVGAGTAVTLITATRAPAWVAASDPQAVAAALGFPPDGSGAVRWDVFDAMLFPGQVVVLATWRDRPAAEAFEAAVALPDGARLRRIRVIREYGMFDRREAPQYYPAVTRVRSGA